MSLQFPKATIPFLHRLDLKKKTVYRWQHGFIISTFRNMCYFKTCMCSFCSTNIQYPFIL